MTAHPLPPIDLGFSKPPADTHIVVAMSGGVDSSVTAAWLKQAGYRVTGVTMQLYDQGELAKRKGACCAGQDIYDAKCVADKLGFPHYVLDYESLFKQSVMDDFADSYLRGETPIPCVRCNQQVKFVDLLKVAKDLGADAMATGHYIQRKVGPSNQAELHQGADPKKDQSYFLFTTTQQQLEFLRFPLGHLSKEQTRSLALRLGLSVAEKPDSQDICFVPNGNYVDVVKRLRPEGLTPGNIVTQEGCVIGSHDGIIGFTIGQRKGLKVGAQRPDGRPWYVVDINPTTHEVIVGPKEALAIQEFGVRALNWLAEDLMPGADALSCHVKIRSTTAPLPATVRFSPGGDVNVVLDTPEFGVAPGQACVFYQGPRVLGGGWIQGA